MADSPEVFYVGVDVGTASVRAALVTRDGHLKTSAQEPITIWEPHCDHFVQSSSEIWEKCCSVVKKVTQGVKKKQVRGVGFDATCSLVVLDQSFQPVAVNQDGNHLRNVVMWMDHRAAEQAARITSAGHSVLSRVGGVMSPEMQPPKLLWLKENLRENCWNKAAHFLDLSDFLSWKATGSLTRSLCTLVCKWTYCPPEGWDVSFWTSIGLEDLTQNNFSKIGSMTCSPGSPLGDGLTQGAAADLGLDPGTAVGASLLDAHAGGLGMIGADVKGFRLPCEKRPITTRMAMICGTSSCHMAISEQPLFVPGVWGPYLSAMVPDLWLNEGGQSVAGRLIDHMVKGHVAYAQLQEKVQQSCYTSGDGIYSYLNSHLRRMASSRSAVDLLGSDLHVWPDFHGNRSPLADPTLKGMLVGLSLSQTLDDLALLYLVTIQALALGTLHILEAMKEAGHDIKTIFLCGGLSKNSLFVQTHANATGLPVVLPEQTDAVLVGAAILGACASHDHGTIQEAMVKMAKVGNVVEPDHSLQRCWSTQGGAARYPRTANENMSSAVSRRNSCRGSQCGTRSSSSSSLECRRRASNCSYFATSEELSVSLSQPIVTITLRFFLAIDLWLSKRLGVCACEDSSWGGIRPLVRLVEFSGHVIPWLIGTLYALLCGRTVAEREIMLNLALALLLDLLLVRLVKTAIRRRRPSQNRTDLFSAFFIERYSFPSGHATRAAMCARFLLAQLVDTNSMRVLVLAWAGLVSMSRLLLARHYVTDVGFGLLMGYCQYDLVERLWVTWDCLQDLLLMRLQERLNKVYGRLWMAAWTHDK